jgi:hypothetical protein
MDPIYTIYQTERTKTAAEQREEDRRAGEIAATIANLCRSMTRPLRKARRHRTTTTPRTADEPTRVGEAPLRMRTYCVTTR